MIPDGLVEPEKIRISKPGSMLGCIFGVAFSLFAIWLMFLSVRMRFPAMYIFWIVILLMVLNILQLILGLPIVHRSRKLPAFLRSIGRRKMLSKPIVVGPGWVKLGNDVWRGDRDMLFIRRTGFRLASSEIDCLLTGPLSRRRMTFSGVGDEDFKLLYGFWNVDEVRVEFVDSELS
jgi:membrane protein implicated in regulation of membrane protease activity